MDGRLHYEINVPEKYYSTLCPFMLLHPLVKKAVKYVLDSSREGGSLAIHGREEGALLVLTIACECAAGSQIHQMQELEGKRRHNSVTRIDQSLKNVFGQSCGVTVRRQEDGLAGMEIQVRLPLNGGFMEQ